MMEGQEYQQKFCRPRFRSYQPVICELLQRGDMDGVMKLWKHMQWQNILPKVFICLKSTLLIKRLGEKKSQMVQQAPLKREMHQGEAGLSSLRVPPAPSRHNYIVCQVHSSSPLLIVSLFVRSVPRNPSCSTSWRVWPAAMRMLRVTPSRAWPTSSWMACLRLSSTPRHLLSRLCVR